MNHVTRTTRVLLPALLALLLAACGATPSSTGSNTSAPGATTGPGGTAGRGSGLADLDAAALAPFFGTSIPTPECTSTGESAQKCRWSSSDGSVVLDVEHDPTFESVEEWRAAFGTAGFDEEIPGVGVAALGGDNPLADGFRASAYTSTGDAYTVTVSKAGDPAAVKALVVALLGTLAR